MSLNDSQLLRAKPRILTLVSHYLPGYKSGGPLRTISSMVQHLGDEFDFYIFTKDRDSGDSKAYPEINVNQWQQVGKAHIYYASPETWNRKGLKHILQQTDHDIAYLNSLFAGISIDYLLLRRLGHVPNKPVILAPRGETNHGALALKTLKKRIYILASWLLRFYGDILWQASSDAEKAAILEVFPRVNVHVAPNLAISAISQLSDFDRSKSVGTAKIVYLARISPIKNLDFALERFALIENPVLLDIYGPISDSSYWQHCQSIIQRLPSNIEVHYRGEIPNEEVLAVLSQYHAFFMPTGGENFGHAILEALNGGCLVLISDRTPWRDFVAKQVGWDLPLENPAGFDQALRQLIAMDDAEFQYRSQAAHNFAQGYVQNDEVIEANRQLLLQVLNFR